VKMAKASEKDIDAAGELMRILNDISGGHYPAKDGEYTDDIPTFFDPDDPKHLRHFYDMVDATLDKSPGYPGRVIGGMCYVILYDKNEIVDPAADTLELHPRLKKALALLDKEEEKQADSEKSIEDVHAKEISECISQDKCPNPDQCRRDNRCIPF
jgi:hypothetical protein